MCNQNATSAILVESRLACQFSFEKGCLLELKKGGDLADMKMTATIKHNLWRTTLVTIRARQLPSMMAYCTP